MKFLVCTLLIALLAYTLGLFLPWWTIAVAAFIIPLIIYQRPGWSFLSGFSAIFFLWALLSWIITSSNNNILAPKIATILPLGGSVFALVIVTAFVGALVGGLAALSGSLVSRKAAKEQRRKGA
jgi:hypothetical protein